MTQFVIRGGRPLTGTITPSGNKNAALPLLAATLLTDQPVVLHNVPRIRDVHTMMQLLAALGVDYLIMGFAPTIEWLFVGRALAGIAGASFIPAYAYLADITPPEKRAQNFGIVGAAMNARRRPPVTGSEQLVGSRGEVVEWHGSTGQVRLLGEIWAARGAQSLKPKHVEGLVNRWQAESLSVGTIKNRMAELRWWAEKIGKQNVIARDNDHYGIGNRQYVTNVSKARQLTGGDLARITDPYTAMSLRLQAAFGLRHRF